VGPSETFRDFDASENHSEDSAPPDLGEADPPAEWDYSGLSDLQMRAIEMTVDGLQDTYIADALNINRRTLWRWKKQDLDYQRALADARAYLHNAVTDRYHSTLLKATNILDQFLYDEANDNNRFRAAKALLNMSGTFRYPLPKNEPQAPNNDMPMPDLSYKMG